MGCLSPWSAAMYTPAYGPDGRHGTDATGSGCSVVRPNAQPLIRPSSPIGACSGKSSRSSKGLREATSEASAPRQSPRYSQTLHPRATPFHRAKP
jgi:hypothetical protein